MKKIIEIAPGEVLLPDFNPFFVFDDSSSSVIFCAPVTAGEKNAYIIKII
jgi:hypothetical protein